MPRRPDAELEERILEAAYRLWSRTGEKSLTMRAVARAAGTTTPTVYQRFKDKRDLLVLLRARALAKLMAVLQPAETPADTCRRFLEYAALHPHEYRLLTPDWGARLSREEPKPTFELIKKRLVEELGGAPKDHARLALALGALLHGTAMMILADGVHEHVSRELRSVCNEACEVLIGCAVKRRRAQRRST